MPLSLIGTDVCDFPRWPGVTVLIPNRGRIDKRESFLSRLQRDNIKDGVANAERTIEKSIAQYCPAAVARGAGPRCRLMRFLRRALIRTWRPSSLYSR
jgi:hypothetical protein